MSRRLLIVGAIILLVAVVAAVRFVPSIFAVHQAQKRLASYVGKRATHDELSAAFGSGGWRVASHSFESEWPGAQDLYKRQPGVLAAAQASAVVSIFSSAAVVCYAFSDEDGRLREVICLEQ